ncbi:MAG: hypothetical protein LBE32_03670 [Burkholderiales bacterium]|jgi:hypothetical protein|nr:hypothetical protein [Burkholderiales bacterium]
MKFQSISTCSGWFFCCKGARGEDIVLRIAAWGIRESGEVVGLIAAANAVTDDNIPRLTEPPAGIKGVYLPEEKLTHGQKVKAALR